MRPPRRLGRPTAAISSLSPSPRLSRRGSRELALASAISLPPSPRRTGRGNWILTSGASWSKPSSPGPSSWLKPSSPRLARRGSSGSCWSKPSPKPSPKPSRPVFTSPKPSPKPSPKHRRPRLVLSASAYASSLATSASSPALPPPSPAEAARLALPPRFRRAASRADLKAEQHAFQMMPLYRSHSAPTHLVQAQPQAPGKQYAVFISHAKSEASMEARFVQRDLNKILGKQCFLDSDDLRDLTKLTQYVVNSDALVLVQSKGVLARPYCLIELLTALRHNVPIVGLSLSDGHFRYEFQEAAEFLTHLDSRLEETNPGAAATLAANGWPDLTEVAWLLSNTMPFRISTAMSQGASAAVLKASITDLAKSIKASCPACLDELVPKETWLKLRRPAAAAKPATGIGIGTGTGTGTGIRLSASAPALPTKAPRSSDNGSSLETSRLRRLTNTIAYHHSGMVPQHLTTAEQVEQAPEEQAPRKIPFDLTTTAGCGPTAVEGSGSPYGRRPSLAMSTVAGGSPFGKRPSLGMSGRRPSLGMSPSAQRPSPGASPLGRRPGLSHSDATMRRKQ